MNNKKQTKFDYVSAFIITSLEGIGGALGSKLFPNNIFIIGAFCGSFGFIGIIIHHVIKEKSFILNFSEIYDDSDRLEDLIILISKIIFVGIGIMPGIIALTEGKINKLFILFISFPIGIIGGFVWVLVISSVIRDNWKRISLGGEKAFNRSRYTILPIIIIMVFLMYKILKSGGDIGVLFPWIYLFGAVFHIFIEKEP
jgi:hypothetical protein